MKTFFIKHVLLLELKKGKCQ